jgi:hypothetical protein
VTEAVGRDSYSVEKIISFLLLFAVAWEIAATNNIRFLANMRHILSLTATASSDEERGMSKRKKNPPTTKSEDFYGKK